MSNITITVQGIDKLLQGINLNKPIGPDNISGKILKEKSDICAENTRQNFHQILNIRKSTIRLEPCERCTSVQKRGQTQPNKI